YCSGDPAHRGGLQLRYANFFRDAEHPYPTGTCFHTERSRRASSGRGHQRSDSSPLLARRKSHWQAPQDRARKRNDVLPWGKRPLHPDRKSTRLNSSHVAISYAVFCLKKKKAPSTCRPRCAAATCVGPAEQRRTL